MLHFSPVLVWLLSGPLARVFLSREERNPQARPAQRARHKVTKKEGGDENKKNVLKSVSMFVLLCFCLLESLFLSRLLLVHVLLRLYLEFLLECKGSRFDDVLVSLHRVDE